MSLAWDSPPPLNPVAFMAYLAMGQGSPLSWPLYFLGSEKVQKWGRKEENESVN
jgi:hypothetical protein